MSLEILSFLLLIPLAGLTWFNWPKAVAGLLFFLPAYLIKVEIFSLPINWLEAAVIILFAIALFKGYGLSLVKFLIDKKYRSWLVIILLWLLAAVLGVWLAKDSRLALGILKGWFIVPFMWLWLAGFTVKSGQKLGWGRLAAKALVANGFITALISLLLCLWLGGRSGGWYNSPNVLAMYLLPIFWLSVWQLFYGKDFYWSGRWNNLVGAMVGVVILVAIILTGSYSALASLVITAALWGIVKKYSQSRIKVILVALVFLLGLVVPVFVTVNNNWPWFSHSNNLYGLTSGQIRQVFWREALVVIKQRPLWGIGLGGWQPLFKQDIQPGLPENKQPGYSIEFHYASLFPHNLYLTVWLFQGIFGLGLLLWLFLKIADSQSNLAWLMLFPWLLYSIVDTPLYKNDYAFLFVFILLIAWAWEADELTATYS
ncbi:O-antigen ligase family protein [Patescibacteria group bacterium]|nr:O-antigen ligase family protein [Patescibacteria group bacterium]